MSEVNEVKEVELNGETYTFKDEVARTAIESLQSLVEYIAQEAHIELPDTTEDTAGEE